MLIDIAVKSLWRRKLRSLLTVLGVAVAIQIYLMMTSILSFYDADIQRQVAMFAGKIFVQRTIQAVGAGGDFPSMTSSIAESTAASILGLDGLNPEESSAVLFIPLVADVRPNMPPSFFIVGLQPGRESAYMGNVGLRSGSLRLEAQRAVILGSEAARHYAPAGSAAAGPGDAVRILDQEFLVAGVLNGSSSLYNGAVIMPLRTAQTLFNHPDTVSAVILTPRRVDAVDGIRSVLRAEYPQLQASNQADVAKNAVEMMSMQRAFFNLITGSAVLSSGMVVMIVVWIAVMEQRREIGTLRAMGSRRRRIFAMVLSESLLLTLGGALASLPVSVLFDRVLRYGLFLNLMQTLRLWGATIGLCLLIGMLAAILPAAQAMRVDPLSAMQME
jgi:putative ABC transport system permease protein